MSLLKIPPGFRNSMYGGSGNLGRGGGKRKIHAPPINRNSAATSGGRLSSGGGAAAVTRGRDGGGESASGPTSSRQAEETFSLVTRNTLNFAMALRPVPDHVEEIDLVEAIGGTARIKFDYNANNANGNEMGKLCDIYEERRNDEDGNGLLTESGGAWRKQNVLSVLDESTKNHVKMRSEEAGRKNKTRNSNGRNIEPQNAIHLFQNIEKIRFLDEAKSLHAISIKMGPIPMQEPVFVTNRIISMYVSLGDTFMARTLFDEMTVRNVVSYNTLIGSYSRDGFLLEAWELLSEMIKCDLKPTQFTFGGLLSCHSLDVLQGMQLHALMEKIGLLCTEPFSGTALLGMYGRNGFLYEAIVVFECMPQKNLVTWNNIIFVFGQMGFSKYCMFLLSEMMRSQMELSPYTFVNVLSCFQDGDMELGRLIHGIVIKHGFHTVVSVSNCLISMYAKCADTCLAEKMFEEASVRDIVSWNTLIGAMESCGGPSKALNVFLEMCATGLLPNERTFVNVVRSCLRLQASSFGEFIHAKMIKRRFESSVYAGTSLVDFYAKRDKLKEAHICFDGIKEKNLVSWNSLILGYSNRGSFVAVRLFQEMIHTGYRPNETSFSIVVKSSLPLELLQLHSVMIKMGYDKNDYALSSLISSYARNGLVPAALTFVEHDNTTLPVASSNAIAWIYNRTGQFDKTQELYAIMQDPDTISWNTLIASCSRNGDYKEAFELFHHMRNSQVFPDNYTYVSLFNVCTKLCNIALGSSLHGLIVKTDFTLCDTFLCNVMIDMYGKCGSLESSVMIFNDMVERNIISWTALISSLGQHGYTNEALERFEEMERNGFKPDKVAFLAVFSACRHVGFVKEGMALFYEMKSKYGVEPETDHYLLIVDLLAKHGHLKEAEQLILGMPIPPNALIWRSFLEGCKKQTDMRGLAVAV